MNYGQSVNPFVVRESATFFEQDPKSTWDWASQGIEYVDDTEDWIAESGATSRGFVFADVPDRSPAKLLLSLMKV